MSENQEFDFESFLQNSGQQSQIELNETFTKMLPIFRSYFDKVPTTILQNFQILGLGEAVPQCYHIGIQCVLLDTTISQINLNRK